MTLDSVKQSIQDFFGDTSRSRSETREGLEELRDEVDTLLESLQDDDE